MMSDQSMDIEEMPDIGAIGGENFNQLGSYDQAYMLAPQNVQVDEHGNTEQFFNFYIASYSFKRNGNRNSR